MMTGKTERTNEMQEAITFCISETEKNILEFYEEVLDNPHDTPETRSEIVKDMQREFHYLYILRSMYSIL